LQFILQSRCHSGNRLRRQRRAHLISWQAFYARYVIVMRGRHAHAAKNAPGTSRQARDIANCLNAYRAGDTPHPPPLPPPDALYGAPYGMAAGGGGGIRRRSALFTCVDALASTPDVYHLPTTLPTPLPPRSTPLFFATCKTTFLHSMFMRAPCFTRRCAA